MTFLRGEGYFHINLSLLKLHKSGSKPPHIQAVSHNHIIKKGLTGVFIIESKAKAEDVFDTSYCCCGNL